MRALMLSDGCYTFSLHTEANMLPLQSAHFLINEQVRLQIFIHSQVFFKSVVANARQLE